MEGDSHDLDVCGRSCRVYVVGADSKSDDAGESTLSEQIKTSPPTSTLNSARTPTRTPPHQRAPLRRVHAARLLAKIGDCRAKFPQY